MSSLFELLGLALAAFLAATVLPFSSEVLLLGLLELGGHPWWLLIVIASLANTAGSGLNYLLGMQLNRWRDRKWFYFSTADMERAGQAYARYGVWTLAFAWLPVIGDALTLFAGVVRVNVVWFFVWVLLGKAARYCAVVYAFLSVGG